MPEYRDILPDGHVHPRSALIAHAANLKDPSTVPAKQLATEFRRAHPVVEKVIITGDTAVLSYLSTDRQSEDEVRSIDVFVYDQGRWRALVSTHNTRSLKSVGPNATLVEDGFEAVIRGLKAQPVGEIEVAGPEQRSR